MTPTQPTSARKRAPNRANARNSTGPCTATGKARIARNACRHGLSRPVGRDAALAAEVAALADPSPSSGRVGWGASTGTVPGARPHPALPEDGEGEARPRAVAFRAKQSHRPGALAVRPNKATARSAGVPPFLAKERAGCPRSDYAQPWQNKATDSAAPAFSAARQNKATADLQAKSTHWRKTRRRRSRSPLPQPSRSASPEPL